MGSSRRNLFRSPQCFALLIFTNIATFSYWIYVRWLPCNSLPSVIDIEKSHNDWQQQELLVSNPTITVTEAKTVTKVKEVVSIQTVTSTVPGPPFCDICGPEDKFCKQYGYVPFSCLLPVLTHSVLIIWLYLVCTRGLMPVSVVSSPVRWLENPPRLA